jgi:cytochrome P450
MKLPNGLQIPARLQMLQWIVRPLAFMKSCGQRYSDMFTLQVGSQFSPLVLLSNPEAIKQIFTGDPKQFDCGSANHILELREEFAALVGRDRHRRERRLLTPPFHGERMQTYGQLICQIAEQVTSHWTIGKPFSVRSAMREISL